MDLICLACPKGCQLAIERTEQGTFVRNYKCMKGEIYGRNKIRSSRQTSTSLEENAAMKFIAHRGNTKEFHENSLEAFNAVLTDPQCGKSLIGIELDIQLTVDNFIPVIHDTSLLNQQGNQVPVSSLTFNELQVLEQLHYNDSTLHIPDLIETFQLVNHRVELNIEIKKGNYDVATFRKVFMDLLEAYSPQGDVVISSFSPEILSVIVEHAGHLNVNFAYLYNTWDAWEKLPHDLYECMHFLHPWYKLVLDKPDAFMSPDLPLQCWTVDNPDDLQQLMNLPCAGRIRSIITNDISLAEKYG